VHAASGNCIATFGNTFLKTILSSISPSLQIHGLPVLKFMRKRRNETIYLQEDLGDISLLNLLKRKVSRKEYNQLFPTASNKLRSAGKWV